MQQPFTIKDFSLLLNDAEFQRSYLFKIWLPDFVSEQYNRQISVGRHFQLCTSSAAFPSSNTNFQAIAFYNAEKKIATKTIYQPFNVSFKFDITNPDSNFVVAKADDIQINSYQYFDFWRNSVYWEVDRVSSIPSIYQKEVSLILIDNSGNERYEFKLENAWPSSLSGGNLDYSSDANSIVTFNVEFIFDRYIFNNYSTGETS